MIALDNNTVELIIAFIAGAVILVCLTNPNLKKRWQISAAMGFGFVAAMLVNYFGQYDYHPFAMLISGVICLVGFKDNKFYILEREGNEINHAISYLYSIRVLVSVPQLVGFMSVETSWIASMILLFIQLFLALGDGLGHGKRINSGLARVGNSIDDAVFQLKKLWF